MPDYKRVLREIEDILYRKAIFKDKGYAIKSPPPHYNYSRSITAISYKAQDLLAIQARVQI